MSGPVVLVPVNRLDRAKGRLAESLTPGERSALAIATLRTVLEACRDAGLRTIVLTADPAVGPIAAEWDAEVHDETPTARGLNGQLEAAIAAIEAPPGGLLILHADLPLATGKALRAFVAAAPPPSSVTMVRSGDGGTNAMLLRPPGRFALAYGTNSFALHEAASEAAGIAVTVVEDDRLALDLDTPADIAAFLARDDARGTRAAAVMATLALDAGEQVP